MNNKTIRAMILASALILPGINVHSEDMIGEVAGPGPQTMFCYAGALLEGIGKISNMKECMEPIKKSCSFKRKDGIWKISASGGATKAACVFFAPLFI
jgi:hypothetical protein